jgi:hypothetical protein
MLPVERLMTVWAEGLHEDELLDPSVVAVRPQNVALEHTY